MSEERIARIESATVQLVELWWTVVVIQNTGSTLGTETELKVLLILMTEWQTIGVCVCVCSLESMLVFGFGRC